MRDLAGSPCTALVQDVPFGFCEVSIVRNIVLVFREVHGNTDYRANFTF